MGTYSSRGLFSTNIIVGSMAAGRPGAEAEAESLHLDPQAWGKEELNRDVWDFKTSKSASPSPVTHPFQQGHAT